MEVEVTSINENAQLGCAGLGVSAIGPDGLSKLPRRLEKLEEGWFFSGPYHGQTRRLYSVLNEFENGP